MRYNYQNNSLNQYTYDDGTMRDRTSVQADWLLLDFRNTSYWYTLVGPPNKCNDLSAYRTLQMAFRFPYWKASNFNVNIQGANSTGCAKFNRFLLYSHWPPDQLPFHR